MSALNAANLGEAVRGVDWERSIRFMTRHTNELLSFRDTGRKRAIVFVHGFNGDRRESWRAFADLLLADRQLADWDMLSFGYGIHSSLVAAASVLHSQLSQPEVSGYTELAFITHSIGGLIVQRALVDHDDLAARVQLAFFFASPNAGMRLPSLLRPPWLSHLVPLLTPLNDLEPDSPLLERLNQQWNQKFGREAPFEYWSIAADRDTVVSAVSLSSFPLAHRLFVSADHLSLIRPDSPQAPSFRVVSEALRHRDVPESAKKAAEGSVAIQEKRKIGISDVFLYCNHADTETVLEVAQQLRGAGFEPWLVVEKAKTGKPWNEFLMRDIDQMKAVAICIGKEGPSWREQEQAAVAGEFARRGSAIIPVYLTTCPPTAGDVIDDLKPYPVVDFRQPGTKPIEHLIEGISGRRPALGPQALTKSREPLKAVVTQQSRRRVVRSVLLGIAGAAVVGASAWKAYEKYKGSQPEGKHSPSRYLRGPSAERVLVFVHGIYGDAKDTWTSDSNAYWPDLIARDEVFNDTDIYVAAYDTGIGNRMNIYELAVSLDQGMKNDGIFAKHRQVIFVCHSLGGLVLQRLLLNNRDYAKSVPRIYFYATPNEGAGVAAVSKLLSQDPLLHEMGSWEQHLSTIEYDWKSAHFSIQRFCAYEKKDVNGIRVVAETSATRSCDNVPVALNKNHIDIVKPADDHDASYVFLRNGWRE